ncbi:MAG: hydroxylamine reductase [Planctomycetes bacterium]|nr:hydroxylamine reductase [Planctomycetota bacterium]
MDMLCRQCEQTAKGTGCTVKGVCGKEPEAAVLQDLILYGLRGVGIYGQLARQLGVKDKDVDYFVMNALFTTITNVNFDVKRLKEIVKETYETKEKIKKLFLDAYKKKNSKEFSGTLPKAAEWKPADDLPGMLAEGSKVGVRENPDLNEDLRSLRELLLYGVKGIGAYAHHAWLLVKEDETVTAFFHKALAALADYSLSADELTGLVMEAGKVNLKCMEILDQGHTERFGNPEPTSVYLGVKKGPAIIVSGHDLVDLEELLKQTEGKGVNIYTHGEMLPAHAYPGLKKYKHLAGHFGSAWQNQQKEFDNVPAAILMTTNCIQQPRDSYKDRIFTTGMVAFPGLNHIPNYTPKDFSKVIEKALALKGFAQDSHEKDITIGFGHAAVLGVAGKVIDAVKSGAIKHFFLIGGCDGAKPVRNYYTEFAQKVPKDCVILTLACGKFKFNRLDFGDINGIPRLLDMGQCNDAYSAIKVAGALADAFKCTVNDLPLSLVLSWYEQKAVCILLTLLSLGIKNIKLGPSLPAFVSPNVLKILVEKFNIAPITTPEEDLNSILGAKIKA